MRLSQRQLASIIDVKGPYVAQIESDQVSPKAYYKKIKKYMTADEVEEFKALIYQQVNEDYGFD